MRVLRETDIGEAYFAWLYDKVFAVNDKRSTSSYTMVCRNMHTVVFQDLVRYDENRIAEAAELRNDFQKKSRLRAMEVADIMVSDASVLEVLIGLAKRADFMVPLGLNVWFQIFMENLKLVVFNDSYCMHHAMLGAQGTISRFNERRYEANGHGGIFPLTSPRQDQREVELWYQMGAYMTEKGMY